MKKTFKKTLSLILAIMLTFSVASVAFAVDSNINNSDRYPLTQDEAEAKAMQYIEYKRITPITSEELYSDDEVSNKEIYKVILMATLEDGTSMKYVAYIDKYDGTVYNKTADYVIPVASKYKPLTAESAFEYTLKALCADKENVVVLKKNEIKENEKVVAYSYEFVEDFYIKHKCVIDVDSAFIKNISIAEPVNIIDRIILMIRVLFARLLGASIL